MMKLEALTRLRAGPKDGQKGHPTTSALSSPDHKKNGRHQAWYDRLTPEEQDEYRTRNPGTKFVNRLNIKSP